MSPVPKCCLSVSVVEPSIGVSPSPSIRLLPQSLFYVCICTYAEGHVNSFPVIKRTSLLAILGRRSEKRTRFRSVQTCSDIAPNSSYSLSLSLSLSLESSILPFQQQPLIFFLEQKAIKKTEQNEFKKYFEELSFYILCQSALVGCLIARLLDCLLG